MLCEGARTTDQRLWMRVEHDGRYYAWAPRAGGKVWATGLTPREALENLWTRLESMTSDLDDCAVAVLAAKLGLPRVFRQKELE